MPRGIDLYDMARLQGRLWTPGGRSNLLTARSEDFQHLTSWSITRSTVASNVTVAPDGSMTADKLIETSAANSHIVWRFNAITAAQHTFTVFAKAAERSWLILQTQATGAYRRCWFNLSTGVVGTAEAGLTNSILSIGNGWHRCSITFTDPVGSGTRELYIGIGTADAVEGYVGDGTSGLYLWGAQLELGARTKGYLKNDDITATTGIAGDTDPNKVDGHVAWLYAKDKNGLPASHRYKNRPPLIGDTALRVMVPLIAAPPGPTVTYNPAALMIPGF